MGAVRFRWASVGIVSLAVALAVGGTATPADAVCNVIPTATHEFRSGVGSANRPYASPGDFVEVKVRPAVCDSNSTVFVDLDGDGKVADNYVVTVLFVPASGGAKRALVLAEDCTGLDLTACNAELGGGSAACVLVNDPNDPVSMAGGRESTLYFRFPDTDAEVGDPDDDETRTGPAKIVVTRRNKPLHCEFATERCANATGLASETGLVACIDELYELDGTCLTGSDHRNRIFSHFTALPPPNNYQAMCERVASRPVPICTSPRTWMETCSVR